MTCVMQSVVCVVILKNCFVHDPVDEEKRAKFGQY